MEGMCSNYLSRTHKRSHFLGIYNRPGNVQCFTYTTSFPFHIYKIQAGHVNLILQKETSI